MSKKRKAKGSSRGPKSAPPPDGSPSGSHSLRVPVSRLLLSILAFAAWIGIAEIAASYILPMGGHTVRLGRHFVWMTPLSHLLFLVPLGLVLGTAGRWRERVRSRPLVMGVLAGWTVLALGLLLERLHPLAVLVLAAGVGSQVARMTRPRPRHRLVLPVIAGAGLLLVLGLTLRTELRERQLVEYRTAGAPTPPPGSPNILLIILDTVRSASLSFMDDLAPASEWEPVRAPAMEALAERSVLFTRAIAPSPWTLPSHASMFTGHWPHRIWGDRPLGSGWPEVLRPEFPTVAEALWRYGYATGGFIGNVVFASAATGLDRGFVTYRDYPVSLGQVVLSSGIGRALAGAELWRRAVDYYDPVNRKDAHFVADEFLRWQSAQRDRPFFAFLNFFDAHEPYPPPDSVRRTLSPGARWNDFTRNVGLLTGSTAWRTEKWGMDREEQRAHATGYHAGILETDEAIGRILQVLEERETLENTVVIVAGDHGEHLGEHGLYGHGNSLYLPLLHVPLMIRDPRRGDGGLRVGRVVSLRHMAATILDLVGLSAGRYLIPGTSLARYWQAGRAASGAVPSSPDGSTTIPPDQAFALLTFRDVEETWYPVWQGPVMYSLVDSSHHYILNGDGVEELYDLRTDPAEEKNLAGNAGEAALLESFRETLSSLAHQLPEMRREAGGRPTPPEPGGR